MHEPSVSEPGWGAGCFYRRPSSCKGDASHNPLVIASLKTLERYELVRQRREHGL
jgi:hypothetical protein